MRTSVTFKITDVAMMKKGASKSGETPSFEMTWGSSTSSGYCSEEDSDSEFEQYFTARTSFFPKTRKANVNANDKKVSVRPKRTVDGRCLNKDLWCSAKLASPSYFKRSIVLLVYLILSCWPNMTFRFLF